MPTAPLAEHEEMDRWKTLPVWAQQELQRWRVDEAFQRGRAEEAEADAHRMRVQLGGLQGWCERNGHDYALKMVLAALGPGTGA
jgi:hypothetical protein